MELKRKLAILFFIIGILFLLVANHNFQTFGMFSSISTLPTGDFCGDSVPNGSLDCASFFAARCSRIRFEIGFECKGK